MNLKRYIGAVIGVLALAAPVFSQTVTYSYNGGPLLIFPSADADVYTLARISVPTPIQIQKVTVRLQISYPQVGDLNVYLYSPNGTRTKLLERNCGSLANVDTVFDDSAQSNFSSFCPSTAGQGPFKGNEPLGNSIGQSAIGIWRLALQNNGGNNNFGYLINFAITITGPNALVPSFSPETVGNEASLTAGPIAPGERVSIFGYNLGPTPGANAPSGNLPTTLGGTTVNVNGTPAPIAYAGSYRVTFVVPSNLTSSPANIAINYAGQDSSTVSVNVRSASPGIYTVAPGDTRVKAYNQDGKTNSGANPAAKGSYLTFYASGLGPVMAGLADGNVAPNTPTYSVTAPVQAYVGGVPATVSFAGLAPGLVGYYQVNLWIPNNAPSGNQSLSLVTSNGVSSQEQAYIYIQ